MRGSHLWKFLKFQMFSSSGQTYFMVQVSAANSQKSKFLFQYLVGLALVFPKRYDTMPQSQNLGRRLIWRKIPFMGCGHGQVVFCKKNYVGRKIPNKRAKSELIIFDRFLKYSWKTNYSTLVWQESLRYFHTIKQGCRRYQGTQVPSLANLWKVETQLTLLCHHRLFDEVDDSGVIESNKYLRKPGLAAALKFLRIILLVISYFYS